MSRCRSRVSEWLPLLIEVAAGFQSGALDPFEIVERESLEPVETSGLWRHLHAPALPLEDLAVMAATAGDPIAVETLCFTRSATTRVRERIESLGLRRTGPSRPLPATAVVLTTPRRWPWDPHASSPDSSPPS